MIEPQNKLDEPILINHIINVFVDIDLEIAKLHEYSEKDFKTFNEVMKKAHENANSISRFANEIIELSSTNHNKKLIAKLKDEYFELSNSCVLFKDKLKSQSLMLSDFHDRLRYLNLPIKNLKQNFFTLKYILANLKLETYHLTQENDYKNEIEIIEQNIKKTTEFIKSTENTLSILAKLLEEQITIESSGIFEIFEHITNNFDRLKNTVVLIEKEYEESEKYYPKIKQKITEASDSINKIVIKLQYQDIIRQKMEHMQIIYKKIINYFDEISKNADTKDDEIVQYYSKIEYIASLQVAQLIQTNHEYEQAIESISEQLLQITLSVNDISFYFRIFTNELPKQEETFINWTKKYLAQIKNGKSQIQTSKVSFTNNVEELKSLLTNFKSTIFEIKEASAQTTNYISNIKIEEHKNLSKTINFKKLKEISNNIENITSSLIKSYNGINPEIWQLANFEELILDLKIETIEDIEIKLKKVKSNEDVLQEILKKSINLAKKISSEVINSIQGVGYYDFFEKSVEEIIGKLNFLNGKLKYKKDAVSKEEIENLKQFENIYTVKTEKEIHNLIMSSQEFDMSEIKTEEDSEVEFF